MGTRIARVKLVLSCLRLLTEGVGILTEDDSRAHAVYCLRGEDVAFYAGECQVEEEGNNNPEVNAVEMRFRGFKGAQVRKSALLGRIMGNGGTSSSLCCTILVVRANYCL